MIEYKVYVATHNDSIPSNVWALLLRDYLKLPGATVLPGIGQWEGETEISYTIVILTEHGEDNAVKYFAERLREYFKQQCVLITRTDNVQSFMV